MTTYILGKVSSILCTKFNMPLYIAALIFIAGLACPFLFKRMRKSRRFREYDRDEVHGLIWEWSKYVLPRNFTPLCPKCLAELLIKDYDQPDYYCVSCGFKKKYDFPHHIMLKLVKIEIEKRERTEEWKDAEKRIEAIKYAS